MCCTTKCRQGDLSQDGALHLYGCVSVDRRLHECSVYEDYLILDKNESHASLVLCTPGLISDALPFFFG